jgi:hypothetical protein
VNGREKKQHEKSSASSKNDTVPVQILQLWKINYAAAQEFFMHL